MKLLLVMLLLFSGIARATAQEEPEPATVASAEPILAGEPDGTRKPQKSTGAKASTKPVSLREIPVPLAGQARIKDIADIQGIRGNQLTGIGLVTGLEGTGDSQSSIVTMQSIINIYRKQGISLNISASQMQSKNVAVVQVYADLPAFAKTGSRIDVLVASSADAKSLQGGVLSQAVLTAADGEIYAVAQGALTIGGFNFGSGGSSIQKNFTNVGRIPGGATVEQEVPTTLLLEGERVQLTLREPDFTTASRIAEALNKYGYEATATDPASVAVNVPARFHGKLPSFIAKIEGIPVTPDTQARIVINERTGTIVVGGNVRLSPGAVSHGAISIRIENTPVILPPVPFNNNPGQILEQKSTEVTEKKANFAPIPATQTVEQLVNTLNKLGVTPRDLNAILQAMHKAGMINAQLEIQ